MNAFGGEVWTKKTKQNEGIKLMKSKGSIILHLFAKACCKGQVSLTLKFAFMMHSFSPAVPELGPYMVAV